MELQKRGFPAFQDDCRYCGRKWKRVLMDCSTPKDMLVPYCLHKDNRIREKGKDMVPICRKEICPYYRKEAKT